MCMALPREAERRSGGGTAAKSGRRLAHRRVGVKAVLRQRDLRQQRGHERGGGRREPHRRPGSLGPRLEVRDGQLTVASIESA